MQNLYKLKGRAFILFSLLSLFSFTLFAQVGINTTTPLTTLDVNGALSLRESPTALDLPDGQDILVELGESPYSQYRITGPSGPFSINRINRVIGTDGQIVRLINTTNQIMTIKHGDVGDLRIVCPAETNLVIGGIHASVTLQYNKVLKRWTVFGYASKNISNKYFVNTPFGTGTDETQNSETWKDLMFISFTPLNPVVYVTYSVHGDVVNTSGGGTTTEGRFRLVNNSNVIINNTEVRTGPKGHKIPYHATLSMFPLSVTPGEPVILKVQWARFESGTVHNSPKIYHSHGRYISVID